MTVLVLDTFGTVTKTLYILPNPTDGVYTGFNHFDGRGETGGKGFEGTGSTPPPGRGEESGVATGGGGGF